MIINNKQHLYFEKVKLVRAMHDGSILQQKIELLDKRVSFEFSNVKSLGPEGILVHGNHLLDPQQITYDRIKNRSRIWNSKLREEASLNNAILLAGKNFSSEGHFVYQHIPRLLTIIRDYAVDNKQWSLLVNPSTAAATRVWLSRYQLPNFKIVEISRREHTLSGIYCSMPRSISDSLSSIDLRYWGAPVNTTNAILDSVVFIARGNRAKRKLLNEQEIIDSLYRRIPSLKVCDYSIQSFDDIYNDLKSATLIVGCSGMGVSPSVMNRSASLFVLGNRYHPFNWHTRFSLTAAQSGNIGATLNARPCNEDLPYHQDFTYPRQLFEKQFDQLVRLARNWKS